MEKGRTFMWMFSMQNTSDCNANHLVSAPRYDHPRRRAVHPQLLLHSRQPRRLLGPAHAPEPRVPHRVPEE
ncbi:MAG: hypothetical protein ACLUQ6_03640 [Alistipes onderdonkii]